MFYVLIKNCFFKARKTREIQIKTSKHQIYTTPTAFYKYLMLKIALFFF